MAGVKQTQSLRTRRSLVRVGGRLFAQRGFDAVSAEEIVAVARVTRGALYHHFDGKQGLFRAVVRDFMREVHDRLARDSLGAHTPLEAVERGVLSFLRSCSQPRIQQVLLRDGPAVLGWHEWRALDLEYGLGLLRRGLQASAAAGQLAIKDVETATHLFAGALIDGAMLLGARPRDAPLRRRVEQTILALLHGLARRR